MALPFLVAFLLSLIAPWMWRRVLVSPVRFGVFSFLILLGTHRVIQVLVELWKSLPLSGGYFLEYEKTPTAIELLERQLTVEALVISILLVAAGVPILYVLRRSMAH